MFIKKQTFYLNDCLQIFHLSLVLFQIKSNYTSFAPEICYLNFEGVKLMPYFTK